MLAMIAGLQSPRRKPQVNAMDQVSAPTGCSGDATVASRDRCEPPAHGPCLNICTLRASATGSGHVTGPTYTARTIAQRPV
jgi:hypothetical protein